MFVLFSCSEKKVSGGAPPSQKRATDALIDAYEDVLREGSEKERQKMTGWKSLEDINALPKQLESAPVLPALERYAGVGYQYLDITTLPESAREWLDRNVIIFDNLFGAVRADTLLPETKLKQARTLRGLHIPQFHQQRASWLDDLVKTEPVLDLRAGFYKAFWEPKGKVIEPVFLKGGKHVNHWTKAYRGLVLRAAALHEVASLEDVQNLSFSDMHTISLEQEGERIILTYEIEEST